MRINLLFFLLIIYFPIKGQVINHRIHTDHFSLPRQSIQVDAGYHINTNFLTKDHFFQSITGEHLSTRDVNKITHNLKKQNFFGGNLYSGIKANIQHSSIPEIQWLIAIETTDYLEGSFNRQSLQLLLGGNSQFAGDQVKISPIQLQYQSYQKAGFGYKKNVKGTSLEYYLTASAVKGAEITNVTLEDASFFTSKSGDSIAFSGSGQYFQSPYNTSRISAVNGFGGAIDAGIKFKSVRLNIHNLGAISWWNTKGYQIKENIEYSGTKINPFADSSMIDFSENPLDSITGQSQKKAARASMLPASLSLHYNHAFNSWGNIKSGIIISLFNNIPPLGYLHYEIPATSWLMPSLTIQYGGLGRLNTFLGIESNLSKKITFFIQSYHLDDLFLKDVKGQGLHLGLLYRIR